MAKTLQNFIQSTVSEAKAIPPRGLLFIAAMAVASALYDLLLWSRHAHLSAFDWAGLVGLALITVVATYFLSMMMIGKRWRFTGLGKYLATTGALFLPLVVLVGLLLVCAKTKIWAVVFPLVMMLPLYGIIVSLLAGWPLVQATSSTLVGPMRALAQTRGVRWGLVLMALGISSLGRLAPPITRADDLWSACVLALVNAGVYGFSLILGLGVAVSAWRHMRVSGLGDERH